MKRGLAGSVFAAAVAAALPSCAAPSAFPCNADADCDLRDGGSCVAGHCAYPSDACDDGLGYVDAPESVDQCVGTDGADSVADTEAETAEEDVTGSTDETASDSTETSGETDTTSEDTGPGCGNGTLDPEEYCDSDAVDNGMCNSTCDALECELPWADCDDDPSNGCEEEANSPGKCGACDRVCASGFCEGGRCSPLVFRSSNTYAADFGSLEDADAACQEEADAESKPGVYFAWLGDGVDGPADRFTQSMATYRLPDGNIVANNFADLILNDLLSPISMDLNFGGPSMQAGDCPVAVWSNVAPDGSTGPAGESCDGYTSTAQGPHTFGDPTTDQAPDWTQGCSSSTGCTAQRYLYCFEQTD